MLVVGRLVTVNGRTMFRRPGVGAVEAPGLSPPGLPEVRFATTRLTANQLSNAGVIYRTFRAAGRPASEALAAIVNAYRESWLGDRNYGDKVVKEGTGGPTSPAGDPQAIGLFQLHSRGAGAGMSVAQRLNPTVNTQTILRLEVLAPSGANFRRAAEMGASIAELAAIFTRDIERPKDKPGNMVRSRDFARTLFGARADEGSGLQAEDPSVSAPVSAPRRRGGAPPPEPESDGGGMGMVGWVVVGVTVTAAALAVGTAGVAVIRRRR